MLKWCPCMGWCLTDATTGGEAKVLLNSMTTPSYNVRRISSFGQTVINASGEEEEVARHGTLPNNTHNGKSSWASNLIPVQPGVTKTDVVRIHKMASIPETSSPTPRNRLKKCLSEADKQQGELSPLRPRRKIPTPEEFAEVGLYHDNASGASSLISEAHSEGKSKEQSKSVDTPDLARMAFVDMPKKRETESTGATSLFQLVKTVKKSTSEKPKSPWMKAKTNDDTTKPPLQKPESPLAKPKTPLSKPKTPVSKPKTPLPKQKSPLPTPKTPIPQPRTPVLTLQHSMEAPTIVIDEASLSDKNDDDDEETTMEDITTEQKEIVVETHEQATTVKQEEHRMAEDEEDEEEDYDENMSPAQSQSTLPEEDMDEVILDGSRPMDSAEIAKQYGLDLDQYRTDRISTGNMDDDLSANISIARIHFSTNLDKEKNLLQISIGKLEGLGGQGAKNIPFDVVVKIGFMKGSHSQSTKPTLSNKPINQNCSLHVKDLATSILRLSVYNSSWQGTHDALGHSLYRVSKCTQSVTHHTLNVSPKSNISDSAGLLEVSFRFQAKVLYIIVHKVFDLQPVYRGCKLYIKVSYYTASKKIKEKLSKTETGDKGFAMFDFESKFNAEKLIDQHTFVMISLKKKGENNKLFKNDKTLGRIFLGPLFYTGSKINFWGQAILEGKIMTHTFSLYL